MHLLFFAYTVASLVLSFLLVNALCQHGWKRSCLYFGLLALWLLLRCGCGLLHVWTHDSKLYHTGDARAEMLAAIAALERGK